MEQVLKARAEECLRTMTDALIELGQCADDSPDTRVALVAAMISSYLVATAKLGHAPILAAVVVTDNLGIYTQAAFNGAMFPEGLSSNDNLQKEINRIVKTHLQAAGFKITPLS